ncbi:hypothetical protein F5Y09DRAFT_344853 [Xylaria sp. FL1042]|nr:hypothetical protein F5Y09DRAFT_344853 [Xylaria sp. FL1042]
MEMGEIPSPAPSNALNQTDDMLHSGFQQLVQHNAAHSADINSHMGSNPQSRYSSPAPQTHMMANYDHASPYTSHQYAGAYHTGYQIDQSPYPQLPDTPRNAYSTPGTSPTPAQADGIRTRSGRAIMRPSTANTLTRPSRVEKSATPRGRSKKRKRATGDGDQPITLVQPLSELVKDITGITDTDIEAYVNRSPEQRRDEVRESKSGKVKRPMNAFMLYRKAYQNRTKEWKRLDDIRRKEERAAAATSGEGSAKPEKGHDNHQVISQVCGTSWNMETEELRGQYDAWAKIERNNHKLAFPDYKFAPAKSKSKKPTGGGRHGDRDSDDDNASNLDVYEWDQYSRGVPSRNGTRSARFMDHIDVEPNYLMPPAYSESPYTSPSPGMQNARLPGAYGAPPSRHHQPHPSSFQYSNPVKKRPANYGSMIGQGQYYQQNTEFTQQAYPHQYGGGGSVYGMPHHHGHVENVFANKTNSPAPSFHNSPVLDHQHPYADVMGQTSSPFAPPIPHPHQVQPQLLGRHAVEHQIDPSLMAGARQGAGAGHDVSYDSLGILGMGQGNEFSTDSLSAYQLDHQLGGLGGSHADSPHPQQFEQAYHTPNDTSTMTPGAEGGAGGGTGGGDAITTDMKIATSEWETTLGGSDFQLEDIDQLLGTATTDGLGQ